MTQPLKNWNEMEDGTVLDSIGGSESYPTGSWRRLVPKLDLTKCVHCLLCWWFCPDSSVKLSNAKIIGIDLDHCKGCGICAEVCPPKIKAITLSEPGDNTSPAGSQEQKGAPLP